ncbi:hypothetical protein [Manganibacter manganicus]|uniref:Uncharacterized protein n=1 Tax=Manganibacter manganicus TaxID=1873176 RepID=A0A1V8RNI6_9HYPH|nr:hypothetical protein [Pseudaminobacter manganicus]OQM74704.1 hypothetical protein BFN67_03445 [Pseudaminobacter manganicus]
MAKTPAEYQRAYRERKAEAAKLAGDPTDKIARQKFSEYIADNLDSFQSEVHYLLEWAGIKPDALPTFETDNDPEYDAESDGPYRGSIGRAERMAALLIDAGSNLANFVNRYKRKEITDRIREIENTDFHDHFVKSEAFKEHARLQKMLDQLDKQVRRPFPQWKVTGE